MTDFRSIHPHDPIRESTPKRRANTLDVCKPDRYFRDFAVKSSLGLSKICRTQNLPTLWGALLTLKVFVPSGQLLPLDRFAAGDGCVAISYVALAE